MLSDEALSVLACRAWPGNVRELLNLVRRMAVFCPAERIEAAHVRQAESGGRLARAAERVSPYKEAKRLVLAEFTRDYVARLLEHTGGNISEAARLSGVERFSLQKILRRLGIVGEAFRRG